MLKQLAEPLYGFVKRMDNPHYGVFKGCYDWHSSVHGYWATFKISIRLHEDKAIYMMAEHLHYLLMDNNAVSTEHQLLEMNYDFEYPYGRSWLLRLYVDYSKWCAHFNHTCSNAFSAFVDFVAHDLLDRVCTENNVKDLASRSEYKNISWASVQLYHYFEHICDNESQNSVQQFVSNHFCGDLTVPLSRDLCAQEFFSVAGNWIYCVIATQTTNTITSFLERNALAIDYLTPVQVGDKVHHLGMNWSRAWAFKSMGKMEEYHNHVQQAWKIHQQISSTSKFLSHDSYYAYDHWVPQFITYALAL
jgi:hypothetical protein